MMFPSTMAGGTVAAGPEVARTWLPFRIAVSLAKLPLEHLAGRVSRQRVEEDDLLRRLEAGEPRPAVRDQRLRRDAARIMAGLQHDEAARYLAPPRVRHADHGGLEDRLVLVEHALDLGRRDVLPARDDHVLLAVVDVEVAVLVKVPDVPGAEPPFRRERGRRSPLALPVAGAH